jgi:hypothetical protein
MRSRGLPFSTSCRGSDLIEIPRTPCPDLSRNDRCPETQFPPPAYPRMDNRPKDGPHYLWQDHCYPVSGDVQLKCSVRGEPPDPQKYSAAVSILTHGGLSKI